MQYDLNKKFENKFTINLLDHVCAVPFPNQLLQECNQCLFFAIIYLLCFALLCVGGCASVSNNAVSDADLARRTALSLGTTPDQVVISNRDAEANFIGSATIHFTATVDGEAHRCFMGTSMGMVKSSVVCSGPRATCNDLQRAAGQCR